MYNVHIEMPSGALSRPHEFVEQDDALELFDTFVTQMKPWNHFAADVILSEGKKEIKREHISNV